MKKKSKKIETTHAKNPKSTRQKIAITNDHNASRAAIVGDANNRCNQGNLIEQLKNGFER